ncbi:DM13 domain-containing protein [Tamlana sp. 62-3]|uniref:DM13 domain-containing protein n=1 Tax=Neotamlana sargassicola TaxID=2883125 RepID=A0A9X1I3T8_9FLAO|nr:DM13 domain-containing protein [Tamlana sargassicola]MCB4807371.1 DM13 domain-containing protein [Tamlana sargassicola]
MSRIFIFTCLLISFFSCNTEEIGAEETPLIVSKSGFVATTSDYELMGSFTLSSIENTNNLLLTLNENYVASTELPGLYVYLTNDANSVTNALSLGPVEVFSGAHNYIIENVNLTDYTYLLYWCEPFSVKVGGGDIE